MIESPLAGFLPLAIHPWFLWIVFGVAVLVTAVMTLIFFYHWKKFAVGPGPIISADVTHLVAVVLILLLAFSALTAYTI